MEDFDELSRDKIIGCGEIGSVYRTQEKKTHQTYVIKILNDLDYSNSDFISTINTISKLIYPTLDQLKGIILVPNCIITDFYQNRAVEYYINMAYKGFETDKLPWDLAHKMIIILGISFGMEYLHSCNIVHGCLSPSNILLDSNFYPKISDYGFSKSRKANFWDQDYQSHKFDEKLFRPPEIISEKDKLFNAKAKDIYNFGMMIYSILHDQMPFADEFQNEVIFGVINKIKQGFRPMINQEIVSKSMEDLLRRCWDLNPEGRPSFQEISRELLKQVKQMIERKEINEEEIKEINKFIIEFCKREDFLSISLSDNQ